MHASFVVAEGPVQCCPCVSSAHQELTHERHVDERHALPDCAMLLFPEREPLLAAPGLLRQRDRGRNPKLGYRFCNRKMDKSGPTLSNSLIPTFGILERRFPEPVRRFPAADILHISAL